MQIQRVGEAGVSGIWVENEFLSLQQIVYRYILDDHIPYLKYDSL